VDSPREENVRKWLKAQGEMPSGINYYLHNNVAEKVVNIKRVMETSLVSLGVGR
jgi:hypothetical protein